MAQAKIDLKKEQQATLARPRYNHSAAARFFFFSMDLIAGRKDTLPKARLLEILASIPYRAWENRQYNRMTQHYQNQALVQQANSIMAWGREAQDNEYWHLLVINEKMRAENIREPWYLFQPIPFLMAGSYRLLSWALALVNIDWAFQFNAEFEDHAEHVYAQLVQEHAEWETQPVSNELVKRFGEFNSWADVFRRISLDERDHMNNSFIFCNRPDSVVKYEGMPTAHSQILK